MRMSAILVAPDPGGLQPVYRIPAARRLVLLLSRAGIRWIHVIEHTKCLDPVLSDLLPPEAFHLVKNGDPSQNLLNARTLNEDDRFLIMRADLVIDRDSLQGVLMEEVSASNVFMPAKGAPADGVYLAGAKEAYAVIRTLWFLESSPAASPRGVHVTAGPPGLPCRAGKDAQGRIPVEDGLMRALAMASSDDGFMARYVDRRISRFFSSRLAHTAISPNQITIAGVSIGLLGAFFLYLPGYWFRLFGAFLFLFCVVVDGVDGEVARLKLMETRFGHMLDIITDNIVHIAVFTGISFGLYHQTGNSFYIAALGLLIGGLGVSAVTVYVCILRRSPEDIKQSAPTIRLMTLLASRDFAYLILLFAAINRIGWFLSATAFGIYLFDALLWAFYLLEIRRQKIGFPEILPHEE